jgi:hypothetical protein
MSRSFHKNSPREGKRRRHEKTSIEDERGWAGQYGQRPANQEEKNYRPYGTDQNEGMNQK